MAQDDTQADGYYDDEAMGDDELDLSFLDQDGEAERPAGDNGQDDAPAKK